MDGQAEQPIPHHGHKRLVISVSVLLAIIVIGVGAYFLTNNEQLSGQPTAAKRVVDKRTLVASTANNPLAPLSVKEIEAKQTEVNRPNNPPASMTPQEMETKKALLQQQ